METSLFRYTWKHSRREQLIVLAMVLASLPFYWFSLDLPKRIVNDAIHGRAFTKGATDARLFDFTLALPDWLGGWTLLTSRGFLLHQLQFLLVLSCAFLALVLVNGAFKYVINIRKGILGERLLRRLRFELFDRLLRLTPEAVRAARPAEIATMIKDEVEPIGGFFGEAFITPALLSTQALTALIFILAQNVALGLIALGVIGTQGLVIPRLRREQLRLGRLRQVESRRLAGRISELVDTAPVLHIHGLGHYSRADIGDRLGRLYGIRAELFRRKFAVKFLNNLLAQVTPFVFYTIGGYLALKGQLDIGQLVAIIAAYRDLPPPIKELIDWDQERADASLKFEQVVAQFGDSHAPEEPHAPDPAPPADAPLILADLRAADRRGAVLLDRLSLRIERPSHVALLGGGGSGAEVLARIIGRQISDYQGLASLGGYDLRDMAHISASRTLVYVGPDAALVAGTMRENIRLVLQTSRPVPLAGLTLREARRTGNPDVTAAADWTDYATLGLADEAALDQATSDALRLVGGYDDVFRAGSAVALGTPDEDTAARVVAARLEIRTRLAAAGLTRLVEPFAPDRFNLSATIGENILFGVATTQALAVDQVMGDAHFRAILDAEALVLPLVRVGLRMAETAIEVFGQLPAGHPLQERYAAVAGHDLDELQRDVEAVTLRDGRVRIPDRLLRKFAGFALTYVEPRHRLGMVDDALRARLLRARESFRRYMPASYADGIEFYEPDRILAAAPVMDNLLFGRLGYGVSSAQSKVAGVVDAVIAESGLAGLILRRGLEMEVGPSGKLISPRMRSIIHLARAVLRRPEILVLDNALAGLGAAEGRATLARLRTAWAGRTLIATLAEGEAEGFGRIISFEGPRMVRDARPAAQPAMESVA
jgi:putative ABC transport system ATP-binding protein